VEVATYPERRIVEPVFGDVALAWLNYRVLPEVLVLVLHPKGKVEAVDSAIVQVRWGGPTGKHGGESWNSGQRRAIEADREGPGRCGRLACHPGRNLHHRLAAANKLSQELMHGTDKSEAYKYDSANRLIKFDRGTRNAALTDVVTPTPIAGLVQKQEWRTVPLPVPLFRWAQH
jgi:hypothetical protein